MYGNMERLQQHTVSTRCSSVWRGIEIGFHLLRLGLDIITDRIVWNPTSHRMFTSKSTYSLLLNILNTPSDHSWGKIWKLRGPPRGPLLLWLIAHDRLKTRNLLWQRKLLDSPLCDICSIEEETTMHAIRDCRRVTHVWQKLVPQEYWNHFWAS